MIDVISESSKQTLAMILIGVVFSMALVVLNVSVGFQDEADKSIHSEQLVNHMQDFTAMAVYGKPVPMSQVVAALDMYGEPQRFCLQMEDLKGKYSGTPYPYANRGTSQMQTLLTACRNYMDKKVYVYTATPQGALQLCVSELPHTATNDGGTQNWVIR